MLKSRENSNYGRYLTNRRLVGFFSGCFDASLGFSASIIFTMEPLLVYYYIILYYAGLVSSVVATEYSSGVANRMFFMLSGIFYFSTKSSSMSWDLHNSFEERESRFDMMRLPDALIESPGFIVL